MGKSNIPEETRVFSARLSVPEAQVSRLASYLGQRTRGLAIDMSDVLSAAKRAQQMSLTRKQYGHDRPPHKGSNRTYHHFILSPSIDDNCPLFTMREYAKAWSP